MARRMRIEFLSEGFRDIMLSSGVDAEVASVARSQAQIKERETGVPYAVEKDRGWDGRVAYMAKPADGSKYLRTPNLDHETWMEVVWPKVGGAKWRPH